MDRDDAFFQAVQTIQMVLDESGLCGEESLQVLLSASVRVLMVNAPDRHTAHEWREIFCGSMLMSLNHAEEQNLTHWSKARMH